MVWLDTSWISGFPPHSETSNSDRAGETRAWPWLSPWLSVSVREGAPSLSCMHLSLPPRDTLKMTVSRERGTVEEDKIKEGPSNRKTGVSPGPTAKRYVPASSQSGPIPDQVRFNSGH